MRRNLGPEPAPARKKLIDRKPNLRVQTFARSAANARDNSPGAGRRGAPLNGAAQAARRALTGRKAPPTKDEASKRSSAGNNGSLPGAIDDPDGSGEGSGGTGHDRHQSTLPSLIPHLSSTATDASSAASASSGELNGSGLDAHTLLLASTFLTNAAHFRSPYHRYDALALRVYVVYRHILTRSLVFSLILLTMLLTYLEEKPELSQSGLLALEFLLLLALSSHTAVELYLFPARRKQVKSRWLTWDIGCRTRHRRVTLPLWRDRWDQAKVVVLSVCFIDVLVAMGGGSAYRVARPCRAYFLVTYSQDTRTQSAQVFSTVRAMFVPFVMVLLLVFFESTLAMVLFHSPDASSTYFASLSQSFFEVFALSTTANFPDVTFPAIDSYGLYSVLFFILCLSIGLYVTVSLLIAYVYTTWREQAVLAYWTKLKNRQTNLTNGFTLLVAGSVERWKDERAKEKLTKAAAATASLAADKDKESDKDAVVVVAKEKALGGERSTADESGAASGDGEKLLSLTSWSRLFAYMHPRLSDMEAQILSRVFFLLLTTTSTSSCSQDDFMDLCDHLHSLSTLTYKDAMPPKTERALALQRVFEHPWAQYGRSALAVLVVVLTAQTFESATSSDGLYSPAWAFALDCLYAAFLCAEVGLAVYINTWRRYISSPWKRASFTLAALSLTGKALLEFIVQPAIRDPTLGVYRAAVFFRLIRVVRVPLIIKRFRLGLKSLVRVFTPLTELFIHLITIYYLWAVFGEVFFSGRLDPDDPPAAIRTLPFYTSGYYQYFHFNTFTASLFTLFHLMAVTNWTYTVAALEAVTSDAAFLYFLSFYFVVGICTLNLVIAYLVETLEIAVKNLSMQRADKDDERRQRREAELWAKEMIDMERDDAAAANAPRRGSADTDGDEADPAPGDGDSAVVTRTMTVAPTIEKRKKRIGVFEEDALKHAERHRDGPDEDEESLSRGRASSSTASVDLYRGISEELTGEGEAAGERNTAGGEGKAEADKAATSSEGAQGVVAGLPPSPASASASTSAPKPAQSNAAAVSAASAAPTDEGPAQPPSPPPPVVIASRPSVVVQSDAAVGKRGMTAPQGLAPPGPIVTKRVSSGAVVPPTVREEVNGVVKSQAPPKAMASKQKSVHK